MSTANHILRALATVAFVVVGLLGCSDGSGTAGGTTDSGGAGGSGTTPTYTIHLKGMMCDGCEQAVTDAAKSVAGTTVVRCDWETGELVVTAPTDSRAKIEEAVSAIDYQVVHDAQGTGGSDPDGN